MESNRIINPNYYLFILQNNTFKQSRFSYQIDWSTNFFLNFKDFKNFVNFLRKEKIAFKLKRKWQEVHNNKRVLFIEFKDYKESSQTN